MTFTYDLSVDLPTRKVIVEVEVHDHDDWEWNVDCDTSLGAYECAIIDAAVNTSVESKCDELAAHAEYYMELVQDAARMVS